MLYVSAGWLAEERSLSHNVNNVDLIFIYSTFNVHKVALKDFTIFTILLRDQDHDFSLRTGLGVRLYIETQCARSTDPHIYFSYERVLKSRGLQNLLSLTSYIKTNMKKIIIELSGFLREHK